MGTIDVRLGTLTSGRELAYAEILDSQRITNNVALQLLEISFNVGARPVSVEGWASSCGHITAGQYCQIYLTDGVPAVRTGTLSTHTSATAAAQGFLRTSEHISSAGAYTRRLYLLGSSATASSAFVAAGNLGQVVLRAIEL